MVLNMSSNESKTQSLVNLAQKVFLINPMYYFSTAFQNIIYYNKMPSLNEYIIIFIIGVGFLALGILVFRLLQKNVAYML